MIWLWFLVAMGAAFIAGYLFGESKGYHRGYWQGADHFSRLRR